MTTPSAVSSSPAPGESAAAVTIEGLTVRFGTVTALDQVSLAIPRGSLYGLLGPNGSGKSTLLKVLVGHVKPAAGRVLIDGRELGRQGTTLGYVPQATTADPTFPVTVAEVVAMGLYGQRPRIRMPFRTPGRVLDALDAVSLRHLRNRQVSELSGGQQRRVMIARALVRNAKILILDEPAAGLDAAADEQLTELLRSLADAGHTVVVATHDIEGVARFFDHAALLAGRCVASGTTEEVLTDAHLHEAFGRQLLVFHGGPGDHHDVTFHQGKEHP